MPRIVRPRLGDEPASTIVYNFPCRDAALKVGSPRLTKIVRGCCGPSPTTGLGLASDATDMTSVIIVTASSICAGVVTRLAWQVG